MGTGALAQTTLALGNEPGQMGRARASAGRHCRERTDEHKGDQGNLEIPHGVTTMVSVFDLLTSWVLLSLRTNCRV